MIITKEFNFSKKQNPTVAMLPKGISVVKYNDKNILRTLVCITSLVTGEFTDVWVRTPICIGDDFTNVVDIHKLSIDHIMRNNSSDTVVCSMGSDCSWINRTQNKILYSVLPKGMHLRRAYKCIEIVVSTSIPGKPAVYKVYNLMDLHNKIQEIIGLGSTDTPTQPSQDKLIAERIYLRTKRNKKYLVCLLKSKDKILCSESGEFKRKSFCKLIPTEMITADQIQEIIAWRDEHIQKLGLRKAVVLSNIDILHICNRQ